MDSPLTLLYRAPDATEAALLVSTLKGEGVPARSVGGAMQWTWGELGAEALQVEIWVPEEHLERGRALIERYYARAAEEARPRSSAWTCACGEENEPGFELCWSCQARRAS